MKKLAMKKLPGLHKKSWIFLCTLVVLGGGALTYSLHSFVTAQAPGQGLEVSPPSQEISVDPGKTTTAKATLRNRSNKAIPITVRIEDFTAKGDEGQIELTKDSPYSVASWTDVTPTEFTLEPGEEQEVTATIDAPSDAAGGRFGSFVFSAKAADAGANETALSQEIASLFLVRVSGPVDEKLTIKSLAAPQFSEFGPVPFDVTFANTGNVHVKTFGLINVTDMFGRKVADVVVPGTNVFPDAERVVKAQLENKFLFGNYTATALMYYGAQNQSISTTTSFFVFPVRIAAAALVVIVILFLMRKRLKKALKALFK
jgi:hypothetical protein